MKEPGIPKDRVDLQLAPVALAVNSWLDDLSNMPIGELTLRIAIDTNEDPRVGRIEREAAVLVALRHEVDLRGWEADIAPRGLRLRHHDHELVLGLPESVMSYTHQS